jgi:hypothetical protein
MCGGAGGVLLLLAGEDEDVPRRAFEDLGGVSSFCFSAARAAAAFSSSLRMSRREPALPVRRGIVAATVAEAVPVAAGGVIGVAAAVTPPPLLLLLLVAQPAVGLGHGVFVVAVVGGGCFNRSACLFSFS